jgi:hypothetical protein
VSNIILIGPVSNDVERAHYLFQQIEEEIIGAGDKVVHNPMRDHIPGMTEAFYMRRSLCNICDLVDANTPKLKAMVMRGWEKSRGSITEFHLCAKLGIHIVFEE